MLLLIGSRWLQYILL
jgi:hypothetical protein